MSGLDLAKNIGLTLDRCKKISEQIECTPLDLEKILHEKFLEAHGTLVAWQIQNITWGIFNGEKILLKDDATPAFDDWLECRIFNRHEEIHLKRIGKNFVGRYIRDDDTAGEETYFVDSFARLWGECTIAADGWITLHDATRKIFMELPCDDGGKKFYGLLTRNYIGSDTATGLSGYVDCRFVAIESAWDGD